MRAFRATDEAKDGNRILNILRQNESNVQFQMTTDGSEILSEFMIDGFNIKPDKPESYSRHILQFQDNTMNRAPILIKLVNVDIVKLLKKIYGPYMTDGSKADYAVLPMGPVNPTVTPNEVQTNPYLNWRLQVIKASIKHVSDFAAELGIYSGRSPIITE